MKTAILGAGAMGCLYGGPLSVNNEVYFIDVWKEHVDKINKEGLRIKKGEEDVVYHPVAVTDSASVGSVDLVIVFVKSVNTAQALSNNRNLFGDNTTVLTLQNGYGNDEDILPYVKAENLLIGTSNCGATILSPGYVLQAGIGTTNIGVRKGNSLDQAHKIAEVLNEAGFESDVSDEVMKIIWNKLLVNAGLNAVLALLDVRNGFMAVSKSAYSVGLELIKEGALVAKAEGFEFNADEIAEKYYIQGAKVVGNNRCSMLQDVSRKKKTEVERINGAISRLGSIHGITTPYNDLMVKLINAKEDTYSFE